MSNWYEDYLNSWGTHEVDQVTAFFTDDIFYEDTTIHHSASGMEQFRKFVKGSFRNVPDARFEFVRGHSDDSGYSIEWIMHPMGVAGASVGRLRDGKICENRDYWNGAEYTIPGA